MNVFFSIIKYVLCVKKYVKSNIICTSCVLSYRAAGKFLLYYMK